MYLVKKLLLNDFSGYTSLGNKLVPKAEVQAFLKKHKEADEKLKLKAGVNIIYEITKIDDNQLFDQVTSEDYVSDYKQYVTDMLELQQEDENGFPNYMKDFEEFRRKAEGLDDD